MSFTLISSFLEFDWCCKRLPYPRQSQHSAASYPTPTRVWCVPNAQLILKWIARLVIACSDKPIWLSCSNYQWIRQPQLQYLKYCVGAQGISSANHLWRCRLMTSLSPPSLFPDFHSSAGRVNIQVSQGWGETAQEIGPGNLFWHYTSAVLSPAIVWCYATHMKISLSPSLITCTVAQ